MSRPLILTFVGGPEDGKRLSIKGPPPPHYRVAVLPRLPVYVDASTEFKPLTFEQFEYAVIRMPAGHHVAYPAEWNDLPNETPYDRVQTSLLRGYVGRN